MASGPWVQWVRMDRQSSRTSVRKSSNSKTSYHRSQSREESIMSRGEMEGITFTFSAKPTFRLSGKGLSMVNSSETSLKKSRSKLDLSRHLSITLKLKLLLSMQVAHSFNAKRMPLYATTTILQTTMVISHHVVCI